MPETPIHQLAECSERRPRAWFAVCVCGKEFSGIEEQGALSRLAAHVIDLNKVPCPNPRKVAYLSKADAERAMPGMWRMLHGGPGLRTYRCRCGAWHLTHKGMR